MSQMNPERFNAAGAVDLSPLVTKANQQARVGHPASDSQDATSGRTAVPSDSAQAAAAANAQGVPEVLEVPSLVIDVTDETFTQIAQLSAVAPVVVDLWAEWCQPCKTLGPILEKVTAQLGGKILLAKVDVDSNPQLAQAFQAQSIPLVVAIVGGKPVQLFQGAVPEQQVLEVMNQLLALAEQQGVTGRLVVSGEGHDSVPGEAGAEPELPPLHQEAFDAIEAGDYNAAVAAYEKAIVQNPRDADAQAGLAQVRLLSRLQGKTLDDIRARASAEPSNLEAQLDVADLDVSGGHIGDGFDRLLDLFAAGDEDSKQIVRERLLELFDIVGQTDPRVVSARARLTSLLY